MKPKQIDIFGNLCDMQELKPNTGRPKLTNGN